MKEEYKEMLMSEKMKIEVIIQKEIEVGEVVMRSIELKGEKDVMRFEDEKIIGIEIE